MDTLLATGEHWTLDTATLMAAIARHFKSICALFFTVLHWWTDGVGIGTLTDFYSFFIHLVPFLTVQVTVSWNTQRGANNKKTPLLGKSTCVYLLHIYLISFLLKSCTCIESNEFKLITQLFFCLFLSHARFLCKGPQNEIPYSIFCCLWHNRR